MWDILYFLPSELALALRKGRNFYLFAYPWTEPHPLKDIEDGKPESINVHGSDLFLSLVVRAKVDAYSRVSQLARAQLNGKVARNLNETHINALKFAYRRYHTKMIKVEEFLEMLRCCAIIAPIPETFWKAVGQHTSALALDKLKDAMSQLSRFHLHSAEWLEPAVQYLSRVLWSRDEFQTISYAASQMALCYPESPMKPLLVEISQRAQGMIKAKEMEEARASLKPWQRTGPALKRSIRIGPRSASNRKDKRSGEGEAEGENTEK